MPRGFIPRTINNVIQITPRSQTEIHRHKHEQRIIQRSIMERHETPHSMSCEQKCRTAVSTSRSWIRASWYNYENNQQDGLYRLIYYSKSALRVSCDVFAHHQEHLALFTVSGSVHPSCCWLLSWMSWNAVLTHPRYQLAATWANTTRQYKYSQVLLMMGENVARNT